MLSAMTSQISKLVVKALKKCDTDDDIDRYVSKTGLSRRARSQMMKKIAKKLDLKEVDESPVAVAALPSDKTRMVR